MPATASGVTGPPTRTAGPADRPGRHVAGDERGRRGRTWRSPWRCRSRSTTRESASSSRRRVIGYRWNQVPFTPPGVSPAAAKLVGDVPRRDLQAPARRIAAQHGVVGEHADPPRHVRRGDRLRGVTAGPAGRGACAGAGRRPRAATRTADVSRGVIGASTQRAGAPGCHRGRSAASATAARSVEHQPRQARGLLGVDAVGRVAGLVVVGMRAAGEEEHRDAFHGKVVVVRPVEDSFLRPPVRQRAPSGASGAPRAVPARVSPRVDISWPLDDHRVGPVPADEIHVEVGHHLRAAAPSGARRSTGCPRAPSLRRSAPGTAGISRAAPPARLNASAISSSAGHAGGVVVRAVEDAVGSRRRARRCGRGGPRPPRIPRAGGGPVPPARAARLGAVACAEDVARPAEGPPAPRAARAPRSCPAREAGAGRARRGQHRRERALPDLQHRGAAGPSRKSGVRRGSSEVSMRRVNVEESRLESRITARATRGDLVHPVAEIRRAADARSPASATRSGRGAPDRRAAPREAGRPRARRRPSIGWPETSPPITRTSRANATALRVPRALTSSDEAAVSTVQRDTRSAARSCPLTPGRSPSRRNSRPRTPRALQPGTRRVAAHHRVVGQDLDLRAQVPRGDRLRRAVERARACARSVGVTGQRGEEEQRGAADHPAIMASAGAARARRCSGARRCGRGSRSRLGRPARR